MRLVVTVMVLAVAVMQCGHCRRLSKNDIMEVKVPTLVEKPVSVPLGKPYKRAIPSVQKSMNVPEKKLKRAVASVAKDDNMEVKVPTLVGKPVAEPLQKPYKRAIPSVQKSMNVPEKKLKRAVASVLHDVFDKLIDGEKVQATEELTNGENVQAEENGVPLVRVDRASYIKSDYYNYDNSSLFSSEKIRLLIDGEKDQETEELANGENVQAEMDGVPLVRVEREDGESGYYYDNSTDYYDNSNGDYNDYYDNSTGDYNDYYDNSTGDYNDYYDNSTEVNDYYYDNSTGDYDYYDNSTDESTDGDNDQTSKELVGNERSQVEGVLVKGKRVQPKEKHVPVVKVKRDHYGIDDLYNDLYKDSVVDKKEK